MGTTSELLKALGIGAGTIGGGAALHGAGLDRLLTPLDYPRQALYNLVNSPLKALDTGDPTHLLGAIPGVAGLAATAVGSPLLGSLVGGAVQGLGQMTGHAAFDAPTVEDLTGTDDFLTNFAAGTVTDPLTWAGMGHAGKKAGMALGDAAFEATHTPLPSAVKKVSQFDALEGAAARAHTPTPGLPNVPTGPMTFDELLAHLGEPVQPEPVTAVTDQARTMGVTPAAAHMTPEQMLNETAVHPVLQDAPHAPPAPLAVEPQAAADATKSRPAAGFYSRLEKAIGTLPDEMKAESVMNLLNKAPGGVSKEEIAATNLGDALKGKKRVTRDDLLSHFKNNEIKVQEVFRGGDGTDPLSAATRYDQLQTPGGNNYRELLLQMPEKPLPEGYSLREVKVGGGNSNWEIVGPHGGAMFEGMHLPTEESARTYANHKLGNGWMTSHWDEPNVLAHARFSDHVGPNGEKILHIEEIQSDLHQEGRKRGYAAKELPKGLELQQVGDGDWAYVDENGRMQSLFAPTREDAIAEYYKMNGAIHDAPFKDNWHELTMKRLIRYASENGYDRITLNPGEQINSILGGDTGSLGGQQKFYGSAAEKKAHHVFDNKTGSPIGVFDDIGKADAAADAHEAASGALASIKSTTEVTPPTKAVLPNWLDKYAKQWGVKVEPYQLGDAREKMAGKFSALQEEYGKLLGAKQAANDARNYAEVDRLRSRLDELQREIATTAIGAGLDTGGVKPNPLTSSIPITPRVRESVMRGQPLLQIGAPLGGSALLAALLGQQQQSS